MSKHTPGPWTVAKANPGFRPPDGDDFQIVAPNWICPAIVWGGFLFKEGEANACLIAAAPEMLALLVDLYEHGYTTSSVHDRVKAMISKATGEQP